MKDHTDKAPLEPDPDETANTSAPPQGWQQLLLLVIDTASNFIKLVQAEATLATSALPRLLLLGILRIPMLLLSWLGFTVLAGVAVYAYTDSPLAGVGASFGLQLVVTLTIEFMLRRTSVLTSMPESRKNARLLIAMLEAKLKGRDFNAGDKDP